MSAPKDYVEVEVAVAADVAKVWSFVSDINVPAQFSREFKGAEWLDTPGLGGTFRGDNAYGDFKWSTTSIVTDFIENESFAWTVGSVEEPIAVWGFKLSGRDGDVLLKMHATMGPAMTPTRVSAAKDPENAETIISKRLHQWSKNMTATVEGIKSLSEH
jgi:hypothetical protein